MGLESRHRFGRSMTHAGALWMALALLPSLAPSASAQAPAAFEARVGEATLSAVRSTLEQASLDSLPVDALRAKVLEGVAKGRPPRIIGQVVARMARDLRDTRAALRAAVPAAEISGEELVAAQMARQQGVPTETVAGLWRSRPAGHSLQIPVTVLSELVRRGISAEGASALMTHVLVSGVPLERAARIPDRFDGMHRPGVAPPAALERALRDLGIPGPPASRPGPGPPRGRGPGGA